MSEKCTVRLFFDDRARYHGLTAEDFDFDAPPAEGTYFLQQVKSSRFVGRITHVGVSATDDLEDGVYFAFVETVKAFQLPEADDDHFWDRAFEGR